MPEHEAELVQATEPDVLDHRLDLGGGEAAAVPEQRAVDRQSQLGTGHRGRAVERHEDAVGGAADGGAEPGEQADLLGGDQQPGVHDSDCRERFSLRQGEWCPGAMMNE